MTSDQEKDEPMEEQEDVDSPESDLGKGSLSAC